MRQLEDALTAAEARVVQLQREGALLKEEVDSEEIAAAALDMLRRRMAGISPGKYRRQMLFQDRVA